MCAGALAYGADEARGVRVGGADGVVAAGRQAPGENFAHVEVPFFLHPVEDAGPESVWRSGVAAVRGAVCCAGDIDDDRGPATLEELVAANGVVGSVAV